MESKCQNVAQTSLPHLLAPQLPRSDAMCCQLAKQVNSAAGAGWIDCTKIDEFLIDTIRLVIAVDGSDASMLSFGYVVKALMQHDRDTNAIITHIYDNSKEYLPPAWRKDFIHTTCEATCTSYLLPKRYVLSWIPRDASSKVGQQLVQVICDQKADFICMGACGRKGQRPPVPLLVSNIMSVLSYGKCSCIVFNSSAPKELSFNGPVTFLVSLSLNVAATKAFVDVLRLSKPGDDIHLVHVRSCLEGEESDFSCSLREKYEALLDGLNRPVEGGCAELPRFNNRSVHFHVVKRETGESPAHAILRYAEVCDADFICVGTNTTRVDRGKKPLGIVSLEICASTKRNFIVSGYHPQFRRGCTSHRTPHPDALPSVGEVSITPSSHGKTSCLRKFA